MKNMLTINPVITENTECLSVKVRSQLSIEKWVCCFIMVYHYTSFHFQLFEHLRNKE